MDISKYKCGRCGSDVSYDRAALVAKMVAEYGISKEEAEKFLEPD
jgi:DNA-directed RNA polymerase subunit RPC12/RpoP